MAAWEDPALRRMPASLAVESEGQFWLIDATPAIGEQLHMMSGLEFSGILLTHAHMGHIIGLQMLGKEGPGVRDLPVYASVSLLNFLRANRPYADMVSDGFLRPVEIASGDSIALGKVVLEPVSVKHRGEYSDTFGLLVKGGEKSFFYCPDIDDWEDGPQDRIQRPDFALVDGTFLSMDELPGRDIREIPHPLVQQTIEAWEGKCGEIWLTHLNHSNRLVMDSGELAVAKEGQIFDLE
ncbi:MAG: hypothetical protein KDC26_10505 [Armatimonadetes bacterium]|nr:hypothetical protein [Armatimonadota bacterium]